ncbi:MAG: NAD(+)/NADH kinase [Defluviitaleaceae bacterium]|nr:NAD(+)/NADH kinase [Defluviitaleaceae bacterium]
MKKIGFFPNTDRDLQLATTRDLADFVRALGCEVFATKELAPLLPNNCQFMKNYREVCDEVDFLVVLGGDGTMLKAAGHAVYSGTPLLGINLGNVGYLTDVEKNHAKSAISRILADNYKIQQRMMLQAGLGAATRLALNDITIYRGFSPRMIQCVVHINGEYMDTFRADGLVISTPTGSTAYNLAAGGPVLKPDAKMVAITPICPASLSARPAVISHEDHIHIRLPNTRDTVISFDGEGINHADVTSVCGNELEILITPSQYVTNIIKTNSYGFYEVLRKKIGKTL